MPLPTLAAMGIVPPAYVRKIRRSDWGAEGDETDARADHAVRRVFLDDMPPYSLYAISSDEDLRRVLLALNSSRAALVSEEAKARERLRDSLDFVLFLPDETRQAGVTFVVTSGNTPCGYANGLHLDMEANPNQLRELCRLAFEADRPAIRCSRADIAEVIGTATRERCQSVRGVAIPCLVPGCV